LCVPQYGENTGTIVLKQIKRSVLQSGTL